ncbi:heme A synthase, partial [Streptomyces cavourensis]
TRARARDLLVVLLAQGAIGYVQYFTDVPEILVGIHMFGSAIMWIAVIRLVMSMRERGDDAPAPLPGPSSAGERGQQEQRPSASAQAV